MIPAMASRENESQVLNLHILIDSIPALIHTGRPDGYLDYFNRPWLEYLGCCLEDVEGWKWTDWIHPDEVTGMLDKWKASIATGEVFEYEARVRNADGQYRWMLHRKVPLHDRTGNIVKWHGASLDVEDIKRAEERAQESERELVATINTVPAIIYTALPQGQVNFCNQRWLEYTGLSQEDSHEWAETGVLHPDDLLRATEAWHTALASGTPTNNELRYRSADGKYRWFWGSCVPRRDENGKILKWYGTAFDIEDRKRAEEGLQRSEAYLAEGQSLSHTGSFGWSVSTGELTWSMETFRIFQYDPILKPSVELVLQRVHPEDLTFVKETIERASQDGKDFDFEHRLLMPNGSVTHVHVVAHAAKDKSGEVEFVGAVMDVTAVKEAQRKIRLIIDTVPGLLWSARPDGWVDFVGKRWLDYTGMTMEQALGWGWEPVFHPDDREQIVSKWREAVAEAKPLEMESRIRRFDGEYRWFLSRAFPLFDRAGQILGWYGNEIDIHDRKLAEERVRQAERELRTTIETIPASVWSALPDGSLDFVSQSWVDFTGLSKNEWVDWGWKSAVHPEDLDRLLTKWREAVATGESFEEEYRFRRANGEYRWYLDRGVPLRDDHGSIVRWYGTLHDVDDRKRAEEALQKSEQQWRDVFENNPTMYFMVDAAGIVLAVNPFGAEQLGYKVDELVSQSVLNVFYERDRETVQRYVATCLKQLGQPMSWELRKVRKNGSVLWVRETARAVLRGNDPVVLVACEDITERKHAEEKIRQQEVELRQVLDLAPQHVSVIGPDRSHLYVNQARLDYFGLTLEEWRSSDSRRFYHPDDWERITHGAVQEKFLSGLSHEFEGRLLGKDGKYRWFLLRRNPLRDENGRVVRWYVAATDIEDRKQAEERLQQENVALREEIDQASMFEEIVGTSPALQAVLSRVSKVAPTDSTVLITGETGTGKELVARAIHRRSKRSSRAFVSVNCAAIPRDLIASELFGHEKGAFTGATQQRLGRFELAGGGTIFLDEIGELPAETQIALLRVLQEHEFERVGGARSIRTDVRVIAATNRDLQAAIAAGTFRSDLFYRLNVFPIDIPPLRERREDIPLLVEYFIDRFARKAGKNIRALSRRTLDLLVSYPWPGNIRELQNVLERSVIVCESENFSVDESWLSRQPVATGSKGPLELSQKLVAQEREMIEAALRESGGRVFGPSGAAAKLGIPRTTLESKIRSLKINKNLFKT
jgi:PAS domain S-box-containing protein